MTDIILSCTYFLFPLILIYPRVVYFLFLKQKSFLCLLPRAHLPPSDAAGGEDGEVRERDEIRHDRRKERQHDRNISRAAPDKRCWTCTLNTAHVTHSGTDVLLNAESFMGLAVILNKRCRIQQSSQALVFVCSDPKTVCTCEMCDTSVVSVHTVRL